MPKKDPRIDAYVAKSAPFAQPILESLRAAVHEACPGVEESLKWSSPSFAYNGQMMAGLSAFKAHCTFGFWLGDKVTGAAKAGGPMRDYGRITSVKDLPPKRETIRLVRAAMKLIDEGKGKMERGPAKPKKPIRVPKDLAAAFAANKKAAATYEAFPPSQKREYVEWITEAKTEETREKRLEQAVAWMAEGKRRHWKYGA